MDSNKGFLPSNVKLSQADKKDLKSLAAFSGRMRRNNIRIFPLDETEIFEKYSSYDNSGKLNLFLLKHKKSIIGCAGYIAFDGILSGKNIKGIVATSAIVDPEYRKIFPAATVLLGNCYKEMVFTEKLFALFFPLDEKMALAYKKRPFEHFADIYRLTNPFIAKIKPKAEPYLMEIKEIKRFDKKEIDKFFKRVSSQHYFLMHTDSNFLNHKYADNPYRSFTILTAHVKGSLAGYIVVEKIGTDIYIVDMVVDLNYPSAVLHLLFKSFNYFDTKTITNTIVCVTHQRYVDILKKAGFFCSWTRECLFYPGVLEFFKMDKKDFDSSNKQLYHFNGFARHLY